MLKYGLISDHAKNLFTKTGVIKGNSPILFLILGSTDGFHVPDFPILSNIIAGVLAAYFTAKSDIFYTMSFWICICSGSAYFCITVILLSTIFFCYSYTYYRIALSSIVFYSI